MRLKKVLSLLLAILILIPTIYAEPFDTSVYDEPQTASQGVIVVKVKGFVNKTVDVQNLLNKVNKIRKEACDEGITIPNTGKILSPSDYSPVKWSRGLEEISLLRSVEASIHYSHTRASGEARTTIKSLDEVSSYYENIGTNSDINYPYFNNNINNFSLNTYYREKENVLRELGGNNVSSNGYANGQKGHYYNLIDPNITHIGVTNFAPIYNNAWLTYQYSGTVVSYLGLSDLNETPHSFEGEISKNIKVQMSKVKNIKVKNILSNYNIGDTLQPTVICDIEYGNSGTAFHRLFNNLEIVDGISFKLDSQDFDTNSTLNSLGTHTLDVYVDGVKQITKTFNVNPENSSLIIDNSYVDDIETKTINKLDGYKELNSVDFLLYADKAIAKGFTITAINQNDNAPFILSNLAPKEYKFRIKIEHSNGVSKIVPATLKVLPFIVKNDIKFYKDEPYKLLNIVNSFMLPSFLNYTVNNVDTSIKVNNKQGSLVVRTYDHPEEYTFNFNHTVVDNPYLDLDSQNVYRFEGYQAPIETSNFIKCSNSVANANITTQNKLDELPKGNYPIFISFMDGTFERRFEPHLHILKEPVLKSNIQFSTLDTDFNIGSIIDTTQLPENTQFNVVENFNNIQGAGKVATLRITLPDGSTKDTQFNYAVTTDTKAVLEQKLAGAKAINNADFVGYNTLTLEAFIENYANLINDFDISSTFNYNGLAKGTYNFDITLKNTEYNLSRTLSVELKVYPEPVSKQNITFDNTDTEFINSRIISNLIEYPVGTNYSYSTAFDNTVGTGKQSTIIITLPNGKTKHKAFTYNVIDPSLADINDKLNSITVNNSFIRLVGYNDIDLSKIVNEYDALKNDFDISAQLSNSNTSSIDVNSLNIGNHSFVVKAMSKTHSEIVKYFPVTIEVYPEPVLEQNKIVFDGLSFTAESVITNYSDFSGKASATFKTNLDLTTGIDKKVDIEFKLGNQPAITLPFTYSVKKSDATIINEKLNTLKTNNQLVFEGVNNLTLNNIIQNYEDVKLLFEYTVRKQGETAPLDFNNLAASNHSLELLARHNGTNQEKVIPFTIDALALPVLEENKLIEVDTPFTAESVVTNNNIYKNKGVISFVNSPDLTIGNKTVDIKVALTNGIEKITQLNYLVKDVTLEQLQKRLNELESKNKTALKNNYTLSLSDLIKNFDNYNKFNFETSILDAPVGYNQSVIDLNNLDIGTYIINIRAINNEHNISNNVQSTVKVLPEPTFEENKIIQAGEVFTPESVVTNLNSFDGEGAFAFVGELDNTYGQKTIKIKMTLNIGVTKEYDFTYSVEDSNRENILTKLNAIDTNNFMDIEKYTGMEISKLVKNYDELKNTFSFKVVKAKNSQEIIDYKNLPKGTHNFYIYAKNEQYNLDRYIPVTADVIANPVIVQNKVIEVNTELLLHDVVTNLSDYENKAEVKFTSVPDVTEGKKNILINVKLTNGIQKNITVKYLVKNTPKEVSQAELDKITTNNQLRFKDYADFELTKLVNNQKEYSIRLVSDETGSTEVSQNSKEVGTHNLYIEAKDNTFNLVRYIPVTIKVLQSPTLKENMTIEAGVEFIINDIVVNKNDYPNIKFEMLSTPDLTVGDKTLQIKASISDDNFAIYDFNYKVTPASQNEIYKQFENLKAKNVVKFEGYKDLTAGNFVEKYNSVKANFETRIIVSENDYSDINLNDLTIGTYTFTLYLSNLANNLNKYDNVELNVIPKPDIVTNKIVKENETFTVESVIKNLNDFKDIATFEFTDKLDLTVGNKTIGIKAIIGDNESRIFKFNYTVTTDGKPISTKPKHPTYFDNYYYYPRYDEKYNNDKLPKKSETTQKPKDDKGNISKNKSAKIFEAKLEKINQEPILITKNVIDVFDFIDTNNTNLKAKFVKKPLENFVGTQMVEIEITDDNGNKSTVTSLLSSGDYTHEIKDKKIPYMLGYNNKFRPMDTVSRAEMCAVLNRLLDISEEPNFVENNYADINQNNWYAKDVLNLNHLKGVRHNDGKMYFEPNRPITRAEFAKLVSIVGIFEQGESTDDNWYSKYVGNVLGKGYLRNKAGKFNPKEPVTRGEVAAFMVKALGREDTSLSTNLYTDIDSSNIFYEEINKISN